jgi:PPOX class probable F420-dependent enzyme
MVSVALSAASGSNPASCSALIALFSMPTASLPLRLSAAITRRGARVYCTMWSTSGKVKRLAHTSTVTLACCTRFGKSTGPSVAGTVRRLDGAEAEVVSALFGKGLWARLWNLIYRLRGWHSMTYEIAPAGTSVKP